MLVILSGSSGSGKTTVIQKIIDLKPEIQLMKTCTTRDKRNKNDDTYIFLSLEEFNQKIQNGEFFEFQQVHKGLLHGTLKSSLERVKESDCIFIKDIDVLGAKKIKQYLGENVKMIFLDVPKEELRKRITARGESKESVEIRLSRYEFENSFKKDYDLIIKNKDVDATVKAILSYLEEEKC